MGLSKPTTLLLHGSFSLSKDWYFRNFEKAQYLSLEMTGRLCEGQEKAG